MRIVGAVALALFVASSANAQDSWKKDLEKALDTEFPSRQLKSGWTGTTVKDPGVTLSVLQKGIRASCETPVLVLPTTNVKNGIITNPARSEGRGDAILRPGATLFVEDIKVADDHVLFKLKTIDLYTADGMQAADLSGDARNRAKALQCVLAISYKFDKDVLKTLPYPDVKKEINTVLATEDQIAAANQKTIEQGQTLEEVEKILGKPEKVVKLGEKTTYIYKDMKVIFLNGKVSDVQ